MAPVVAVVAEAVAAGGVRCGEVRGGGLSVDAAVGPGRCLYSCSCSFRVVRPSRMGVCCSLRSHHHRPFRLVYRLSIGFEGLKNDKFFENVTI